jgi:hypothetical protein
VTRVAGKKMRDERICDFVMDDATGYCLLFRLLGVLSYSGMVTLIRTGLKGALNSTPKQIPTKSRACEVQAKGQALGAWMLWRLFQRKGPTSLDPP